MKTALKHALLKGDNLRELMLFIYLSNKYGRSSEFNISELKKFFGYSAGGIYNALDASGFFVRNGSDIKLSKKGNDYVKKQLMTSFESVYSVSYLLIVLGWILLVQWYLYTYHGQHLLIDWQVGLAVLMGGHSSKICVTSINLHRFDC